MEKILKNKNIIILVLFILFSIGLILYLNSSTFYKSLQKENPNANYVVGDPQYMGDYYLAEVVEILEEARNEEIDSDYQLLKLKILSGDRAGEELEMSNEVLADFSDGRMVKVGEKVVVNQNLIYEYAPFVITERYRIGSLVLIGLIFIGFVIAASGKKGIFSILGLGFSIFVLIQFVIPQILLGRNPLLICIIGALMITTVSIYLAHGFSRKTTLSVISTLITVTISAILALVYVNITSLFGLGSEESYFLKFAQGIEIDLRGLLLGGIIFGALGVLDDVTTSQTAAVNEIKNADPKLGFIELYKRGLSVGREHIASLINTLALAYIGSSFPVLLLFSLNKFEPLWTTINSEFIAEEIVRTLVGSSALVLAVPISTFIAAKYLKKEKKGEQSHLPHIH